MHRQWWSKPVTVETRISGQRLTIGDCEAATIYMLRNWPAKPKGRAFKTARAMLVEAHEGKIDAELARNVFLALLKESDVQIFE